MDGILERGDESPAMKAAHSSVGAKLGDHVMFQVGQSSYFPVVRDQFLYMDSQSDTLMLQFRDYGLAVIMPSS
jgi:hypothetical protein